MNTPIMRSLALLLLVTAPVLKAQVPQLINYQGRVAVGTRELRRLRPVQVRPRRMPPAPPPTGATTAPAPRAAQPTAAVSLTVTKGLYSVLLGDATLPNMTAIPATVFTNADVRLRVWFNDGTNGSQLLTPDQRIAAVGYAMMAGTLQSGATISTSTASPAVSLSNTEDQPAALSLITGFRTWWVGPEQGAGCHERGR